MRLKQLLLASALLAALPALADDETIVVTGTRSGTKLLDLAGNDSVLSTDQIQFTAPGRPAEILNQIPGVYIQPGSGEEHTTAIRSAVLNGGAGQGSQLYLEDGVPLRSAGFGNVNGLYEANIEQAGSVEVVRGPGSALYGSNAEQGLINIIPRAPTAELSGQLDVVGGEFGLWQQMGTVSDTIGNNAFRVSAENDHNSGWRDDTRVDEQKMIVRDVWSGGSDTVTTTVSGQMLNQQTGAYLQGNDSYLNDALAKTNPVPNAYRKADSIRGQVRWQHDFGDGLELSITPFTRYTAMNFLMHYLPSLAIQTNAHYSFGAQTMLYKNFAGGHLVILGLDTEYTDGWYTENQYLPTFTLGKSVYPHGLHYDMNVQARTAAPYIQSEWQLLDHTRLTAGIRVEETAYGYSNEASSGIFGLFLRPADRSDDFLTVTPKIGMVQQLDRSWSTYVNLSTGARAPQVTDLYELQNKQTVGQVKAESVESAEIGTRGSWQGVTFDLAGYWMNKDHYFYRAADGLNVPDGKTTDRGIELSLSTPLAYGFDIGFSGTYADHIYDFSLADSTLIASVTKGSEVPEAPHTMANTRLGYSFAPDIRAELEWVHMGSYYLDNADTHSYGGHELINLRASAKLSDWLTLHGKIMNLTDRPYADRAAITTTGINEYFPGAPLTVIGGVTASF
jgi:outer membrane receptor protein involved in Fe transport